MAEVDDPNKQSTSPNEYFNPLQDEMWVKSLLKESKTNVFQNAMIGSMHEGCIIDKSSPVASALQREIFSLQKVGGVRYCSNTKKYWSPRDSDIVSKCCTDFQTSMLDMRNRDSWGPAVA